MGLPAACLVQLLKVHHSTGTPILLGCDDHGGTPLSGLIQWHFFKYSKSHITVKTSFHFLLPVNWNLPRFVDCIGLSTWVHIQAKTWTLFHEGKCLSLTGVES